MLRPVLFVLYTADLVSLIESHSLSPHLYADDTQVYGSCSPAADDALSVTISECIADVASWVRSNRLQLNSDKTEVTWCNADRRQHQLDSHCRLTEFLLPGCRPFVENGIIRYITYEFLLAFQFNYGIFCIIYEIKRGIGRESRFLHFQPAFDAPRQGGPRRNIAITFNAEKLE